MNELLFFSEDLHAATWPCLGLVQQWFGRHTPVTDGLGVAKPSNEAYTNCFSFSLMRNMNQIQS